MSNINATRNASRLFLIIVVVILIGGLLSSTIIFVQPDEIGIVISRITSGGIRSQPLSAGLHFVVPLLENVEKYSISRQTYTMSASAGEGQRSGDDSIRARTKDGQEVFLDASVIYSIQAGNVVTLHKTWQKRYPEELVRPLVRGVIRDAASRYGIEEIVSTKRSELEQLITQLLEDDFANNNLVMNDFVLRDIHFSAEYAVAVEKKQIAEQEALQAQFVVQSKKQEAEQARQIAQGSADAAVINSKGAAEARLIEAEAEATANQLVAASIRNNPELITYLYVLKLSPGVQTIFIPTGNQFILPLPNTSTGTESTTPTFTP